MNVAARIGLPISDLLEIDGAFEAAEYILARQDENRGVEDAFRQMG